MEQRPSSLRIFNHRRNVRFLQAILAVACCCGLASAQVPDLPGWDLVWNDEFDGVSLDTTKWTALDRRDSFNNEKQYYHPNQVSISGGNLQLTAIDVPRAGKDYQSGLITSNNLFGPGRFEARIDLPTSQGMWPAFWLNSNHIPWPQGGEIDILENRGSQPNLVSSAYHWQTNPGPCCGDHQFVYDEYTAFENGQPVDFHAGFHTYAAEWDETTIRYYVDDNLHYTVTEAPDRPIFETAKNIIVNLAVGGFFGGDPDGTTVWPQTMLVDYVRYWQRSDTPDPPPGGNLLTDPGFEDPSLLTFDGGPFVGSWEGFNNGGGNTTAITSTNARSGATSLELGLQDPSGFAGVFQDIAVAEGDEVTFSGFHALAAGTTPGGAEIRIEWVDAGGGVFAQTPNLTPLLAANDAYAPFSLSESAPAGTAFARPVYAIQSFGAATPQTAFVDDLSFTIAGDLLQGDADGDGDVDGDDLIAVQTSFGSVSPPPGDADGDGDVDGDDLISVQTNFGATAAVSVPEPAGFCLALIACLAAATRRR